MKRHIDENSITAKIFTAVVVECWCDTIWAHSLALFRCTSISTYFVSQRHSIDNRNEMKWNAATLYRYYTWLTLIKSKLKSNLNCLWSRRRRRRRKKATRNKAANWPNQSAIKWWNVLLDNAPANEEKKLEQKRQINNEHKRRSFGDQTRACTHHWPYLKRSRKDVNVLWCLNQIERIRARNGTASMKKAARFN